MSITIHFEGAVSGGLLKPKSRNRIFDSLVRFFTAEGIPLVKRVMEISRDDSDLYIPLYPAEEPAHFHYEGSGRVSCTARTNGAGPGYYHYVITQLEACEKACGIRWQWEEACDGPDSPGEYHRHHDFRSLQMHMAKWLQHTAQYINWNGEEMTQFSLSLPLGFSPSGDHFAASALGCWERSWFEKVARSGVDDLEPFAQAFFPWWDQGCGPEFWLNTARVLLWCDCPWHEPASLQEFTVYKTIDDCLELAYRHEPSLRFPWAGWRHVREILEDETMLTALAQRATTDDPEPEIGFRRKALRLQLTGGWSALIPGYFYDDTEDDGSVIVYWHGDRTVRGSSLKISNNNEAVPATELAATIVAKSGDAPDAIPCRNERLRGYATIAPGEEDDHTYWMLSGEAADDGSVGILTVAFDKWEDKDWAIEVWHSLEHESAEGGALRETIWP